MDSANPSPNSPPSKKIKLNDALVNLTATEVPAPVPVAAPVASGPRPRQPGVAPIKPEYLLPNEPNSRANVVFDDDAAEQASSKDGDSKNNGKNKKRGQNKNRRLHQGRDTVSLCEFIKLAAEVATPKATPTCPYGAGCKYEHDLSVYVAAKPVDLDGVCPVFSVIGWCPSGLKCRWLGSHFDSINQKLVINDTKRAATKDISSENGRLNGQVLNDLQRKKYVFEKSDEIVKYLDKVIDFNQEKRQATKDSMAQHVEVPIYFAAEKKRLDLRGKYIVSPLTTVGNLPYRRLMRTLGANHTYGEMALSLPLIQGQKSEWALTRSHAEENNAFGVQITAGKHWQAIKATEAISDLVGGGLAEINLNCGCPIDLVYRAGAGSALMDNAGKLARIVRGMSAASGDIPITVKIRTGTKDSNPTAISLANRLINDGQTAAITLHGRSRQQRYSKSADWNYIGEVAKTVKELGQAKVEEDSRAVRPWVVGNGDCYTWEDWHNAVDNHGVDSVMVARGALIKPWIFEEIDSKQYIDKSATERLEYIKQYCNFGLEHWGSDEYGINQTRRFLCEFMSFTHRYVPIGLLEYMPPKMNDRPGNWKGRNELETLLGSNDYKDWVKISEMFLGPVGDGFDFKPKHKSNAF
ncbi:tRNA-dihydrouridine synthase 3 [Nadsonia fulvescens var. elongata DSM 6958]|uniref:tRNA-dihydrouridine(47) synthase [NAD(P)(+)] n=1 Tax=Nadsonia fulvescens var. elongata DSM 6958 TaxID=857566 RepID=A0A1E3PJ64_9ASCO|nr:tRNA-dihydrouridine synthase 3 [Nadsonia fulvescens var. elongata DSM 6958]